MDIGRAMEVADLQAQTMEEQWERAAVNQVNKPRARVKFGNRYRGTVNSNTKAQQAQPLLRRPRVDTVGDRIRIR